MEAPQPTWEIRTRVCTVALSRVGLCGQYPQPGPHQLAARPTYPQRPWPLPGSPLPGQESGPLQTCWGWGGGTSRRAKKVRWSQRHSVACAPGSVEQPSEDQSPVDPGEEGRGPSGREGGEKEEEGPGRGEGNKEEGEEGEGRRGEGLCG